MIPEPNDDGGRQSNAAGAASAGRPSLWEASDATPAVRRASFAAVVLAVALFLASALYGIDSPFYYGHYGYHGGSHATWARGTIRHHTLFPVNEPGFAPPRPGTYYIHHPVLTHQFVTLTFLLFGEHEWSVRVASLISAFLCLFLVTAIAWQRLGPLAGATAALIFAVVPVNVWYSINMDPGYPSIACLLGFFWLYLRWLDRGRWGVGIAALGAAALAGGFEWSPFIAFPVIFAHVAWTGIVRRGRYLLFAALHPLVVLVPLATHFLSVWKVGMWNDLMAAYRNRAAAVSYEHFVKTMAQYGETLFGRVILAAMFLWLLVTIVRIALGQGRAVDLVGLTFAFALLVYIHVFKVAVVTHAYRQLYGCVWATVAVADLTRLAGKLTERLVQRLVERRRSHLASGGGVAAARAGQWMALLMAGGVLLATAPTAWAGLMESRAHGGIPGWKTFNPDLRQTAFAREVNRLTRPGDVLHFQPAFAYPPPIRMDWAFYYDRDLRRGALLRPLQRLSPPQRNRVVALVQMNGLVGDELRAFAELASRHPVLHIQDLVMIDLRANRRDLLAYSITLPNNRGSSGPLRRWLQGPYPVPRLLPDARMRAADEQLIRATLATPPPPRPAPPPKPLQPRFLPKW